MKTKETLGNELRHFRKLRGLTQEALANDLDISASYLGSIERGTANPSFDYIDEIAERLGLEVKIHFEVNKTEDVS